VTARIPRLARLWDAASGRPVGKPLRMATGSRQRASSVELIHGPSAGTVTGHKYTSVWAERRRAGLPGRRSGSSASSGCRHRRSPLHLRLLRHGLPLGGGVLSLDELDEAPARARRQSNVSQSVMLTPASGPPFRARDKVVPGSRPVRQFPHLLALRSDARQPGHPGPLAETLCDGAERRPHGGSDAGHDVARLLLAKSLQGLTIQLQALAAAAGPALAAGGRPAAVSVDVLALWPESAEELVARAERLAGRTHARPQLSLAGPDAGGRARACGRVPLGDALGFTRRPNLPAKVCGLRPGVVAEEARIAGQKQTSDATRPFSQLRTVPGSQPRARAASLCGCFGRASRAGLRRSPTVRVRGVIGAGDPAAKGQ
jgi:hypothetical protein